MRGALVRPLAAHSDFGELVQLLLDKGADPNAAPNGFTAPHEAIMRRDEKMVTALLDHKADPNLTLKTWTPARRSSDDFNFEPGLVGATPPFWLAARFDEPNIMRLLRSMAPIRYSCTVPTTWPNKVSVRRRARRRRRRCRMHWGSAEAT